ncbi:MAG: hypothetical protein KA149_08880 [Chitinophagales bacterium]|nr:hypothetical protein [Chitinophagales bacterium]
MKALLFLFSILATLNVSAEKLDSLSVKSNGVSHVIKRDDVVHLGYGKNPYGSFQFIELGSPPEGMTKQNGGKTGTVSNIRYWKMNDSYELIIKVKGAGSYVVKIPQAIEVGEIIGFNETYFKKE